MTQAQERRMLAALLFSNFVIGTGILLPAGMLNELAQSFNISVPYAGTLMLLSGLVVAVGAPLAAAFTSAIDRRWLLAAATAGYALCHVLCATAPSFAVLLVLRVILSVPAAIFTPQAAATVGVLLPPEKRSSAITMIFVGWSLATVGGVPLGGYVAHALGWRTAFAIVGVLSVLAWFAVAATVPRGVRIPPLNLASWRGVIKSEALMTVLLVTVLNGTGQFTFFTYVAPSLKASLAAGPGLVTLILALYGTAATIGNILATRNVGRTGAPHAAFATLVIMAAGMLVWFVSASALPGVLAGAALWGLGTFAVNSVQQARLAGIAPHLTSASIALNTSAIYFGQAAGSGIGGVLIKAGFLAELPVVGAAILLAAAAVSTIARRWETEPLRL